MKRKSRLTSIALVLGAAVVLIAVGCGVAKAVSLGPPGNTTETTSPAPTTTEPGIGASGVYVWFARSDGLVPVKVADAVTEQTERNTIEALLLGPTAEERAAGLSTAIPEGTKLLGLTFRDGVATIDLTSEYASGGGALSMQLRLGQVVYTLTQFHTIIQKVLFQLDGAPVHVFSSEGIVLDGAVDRSDYVNLLPPISVAEPTVGERISSPVTVSGEANVFEANVSIEVLDAQGKVVGKTFTTATCGTGCRGTYSVPVKFTITTEQPGTIVVHDDDAAGTGTPPHIVRIPVTLAP